MWSLSPPDDRTTVGHHRGSCCSDHQHQPATTANECHLGSVMFNRFHEGSCQDGTLFLDLTWWDRNQRHLIVNCWGWKNSMPSITARRLTSNGRRNLQPSPPVLTTLWELYVSSLPTLKPFKGNSASGRPNRMRPWLTRRMTICRQETTLGQKTGPNDSHSVSQYWRPGWGWSEA